MTTRAEIVAAARSYLGVRWRHKGRTRHGVDCVGLLVAVSNDLGLGVKDTDLDYKRTPDVHLFLQMLRSQSDRGDFNNIRPGSILMMRQHIYPCHCGIAVFSPTPSLIHAAANNKQVIEEPLAKIMHELIEVREFKGVV